MDIDRPWDVDPDATSTVNLVNLQGRELFVNNEFSEDYTHQDYYTTLDVIRADNSFPAGPAVTWAGLHYTTFMTPWHIQTLNNRIGSIGSFRSFVGDTQADYSGVAALNLIYRNNIYANPATGLLGFETKGQLFIDSLIEHNTTATVTLGRTGSPLAYNGVVLRGNKASYNAGNLAGKDLTKIQGVVYVP